MCKTTEEWKKRSIYHILTDRFAKTTEAEDNDACTDLSKYCGGTFKGITRKLDYIAGMGFDAIWISPVTANTPDGYHGYWTRDFYKINEHFGTADDLKELVEECHKKDIYVMVDVVVNHVGQFDDDYNMMYPFNRPEHYHDCDGCETDCGIDYKSAESIQTCQIEKLPDLNQHHHFVRDELFLWIKWLTTEFNFDGYRIDTVKHISLDFLKDFTKAAGVFCLGEYYDGDQDTYLPYAEAMDSLLNYVEYYAFRDVFVNQHGPSHIYNKLLGSSESLNSNGVDFTPFGTFIDNHDVPRFLFQLQKNKPTESDQLFEAGLVSTFFIANLPIIYYGTEQRFTAPQGSSKGEDPDNREPLWLSGFDETDTYNLIKSLNKLRKDNATWETQTKEKWMNPVFMWNRGDLYFTLATNKNQIDTYKSGNGFEVEQIGNKDKACEVFGEKKCYASFVNGVKHYIKPDLEIGINIFTPSD